MWRWPSVSHSLKGQSKYFVRVLSEDNFETNLVGKLRNAIHGAYDQPAGIQHMLRPELLLGPSIAGVELNSEKVADIPIDAVADLPQEVALLVKDPYLSLKRDRILDLKTSARQRNVLKVRQALADSSGLVPPLDIDHVRAQYSGFYSPVEHIYYPYRPAAS